MLLSRYVAHPHRRTQRTGFLQTSAYRARTRTRDPCCLISHLLVVRDDYSRFKAAHIFPRTHDVEVRLSCLLSHNGLTKNIQWTSKGYPNRITDPATLPELGGPTKIDSIQNVILLRSDLHDAWNSYKFAVNPDVCSSLSISNTNSPFVLTAWACGHPVRSRLRRYCWKSPQT